MTEYATAVHLKSTSKAALEAFTDVFKSVLPLAEGRLSVPETVDAEGNTVPAQPAIGEVGTWYTTVMLYPNITFDLDSGIELADEETVGQLCGKWN